MRALVVAGSFQDVFPFIYYDKNQKRIASTVQYIGVNCDGISGHSCGRRAPTCFPYNTAANDGFRQLRLVNRSQIDQPGLSSDPGKYK